MRILVFSDTHGYYSRMISVINKNQNVDAIIHCGDILNDVISLKKHLEDKIPVYYVIGNNDFSNTVPTELSLELENNKIFITHGHKFGVKSDISALKDKIKSGYNLVLYGHTHKPDTQYFGGGIILNPGAMCHSRSCTYADITITKNDIKTKIEAIY